MMARLGLRIAAKCLQSSVSSAVGMQHEHHAIRAVQPHGLADLFQHKLPLRFLVRSRQALGTPRNANRIGPRYADALEQLAERQLKAVVVTPDHCRIAM